MVGTFAPTVLADPASPLTVTKTADKNPVASGQELTYTIAVTNTGGAKVTNVVLTDQVNGVGVIQNPPAMPQLILTSSQGSCVQGGANGNVVTCQIGTVQGFASFNVTIRGQVTAGNSTTLNNTASVTGTKSAQNFTTTGSVSVLVSGGTGTPLPDLTINKTGPTSVGPSTAMSYTLTVNNIGTANTANVRVVDTLPAGVAFVSTSTTSLFVCTTTGDPVKVTCDGGAVNQGQNATITINATSPAAAGQITNTAVVDPVNTIAESNELNNTSATVNTTVGGPPATPLLSIYKTDGTPDLTVDWDTGAGPDPVNPGQQLIYKIQVVNNATTRADDVVMTDGTQGLEATGLVATQVVTNGAVGTFGGCVVNAPQVRCSIRSLNPGGTVTYTITGTVTQSAGSTIFNTATVTGNIKNVGVSNTDSEATTIRPRVDLTITKGDSPDPVCARSWPRDAPVALEQGHLGSSPNPPGLPDAAGTPTDLLAPPVCLGGLRYDFVIGNSGNGPATGVEVRDWLPAGLIFDSYTSTGGFSCGVDATNVIDCTGGTIAAADTETLSFLLVAPPNVGSITNRVTVDPDNHIFEPDETNNDATQTTTVSTGIDLVVWKGDSDAADPPGDDVFGAPTLVPGTDTDLGDGYDAIATRGTQTYTIYVDNVGTQDATGIRLRDTLPADTIFLSVVADPDQGFTCSHNGAPTGGIVECIDGHLAGTEFEFYEEAGAPAPAPLGDEFATIKIRVFARKDVGPMQNVVRVDPLNEIAEVNEQNNLDTEDTTVVSGNADQGAFHQLKVTKTQTSPDNADNDTVATNGTLVYNLLVENLGTDPVSNIVVTDTLPAGTRFIEVKDTVAGSAAFSCLHNGAAFGGVITCTGGDLNGSILKMNGLPNTAYPNPATDGTKRNITIKVFAPNTPATYTNQADVDPANLVPEGDEFDNNTQLDTIVAPCVGQTQCTSWNAFHELTIAKSQVSPAPPKVVATNGVVTYDLVVTNLGSDPVSGISVKDTLPEGSRFIDARDTAAVLTPEAFVCGVPDATRTITCSGATLDGTLNTLGGGVPQDRTIRIRIFAPNTPTNSLVNYPNLSNVDPSNAIPEGNEFNNSSNIETPVAPCVGQTACTDGNAFYELTIEKEQNRPTIARNGLETYTLTIKNLGSDPVSNIVVQDALPAGARFLDAKDTAPPSDPAAFTCGSPDASGVLTCTGGDLSGTASPLAGVPTSRQIKIRVFMPDTPETYPNQATVDPYNAVPEGNEFNNTASLTTDVQNGGPNPYINLTIQKTDTSPNSGLPNTVPPGSAIFYELLVTNLGEGDAFNVEVADFLPFQATYFVANDSQAPAVGTPPEGAFVCAESGGTVTCTGGTIPANGGSRTINVKAFAPTNLEQYVLPDPGLDAVSIPIVNHAFVDPDNAIPEGDESDNTDYVLTIVKPNINLTVVSKDGPTQAQQNQVADYVITVKNEKVYGNGAIAVNTHIVDYLPVGLIPLGSVAVDASNVACQLFENPVNYVECVGDLEPDQTVVITVHVFITAESGTMYNQACIDPDHLIAETDELDNCKTETTAIGTLPPTPVFKPDLLINKSADTNTATPGEFVTYTVTVSNVGDANAPTGITMTDDLPPAVTFVQANATNGFNCNLVAGDVKCTDPGSGLAVGGSTVITIKVKVNDGVTAAFTNSASVSTAAGETNTLNNGPAIVSTNAGSSGVDLELVSIVDAPDPVNRTKQLTYTIIATNNGTDEAGTIADPAVVRIAVPPSGVTLIGAEGSNGFNCGGLSGGFVTCEGIFPAGGNTVITMNFTVLLGAPDDLVLSATVDPDNDFPESDEGNNSSTQTTTVSGDTCTSTPCIDLVAAQIFGTPSGPVDSGANVKYTFVVVNVGDTSTTFDPDGAHIHFQVDNDFAGATITAPAGFTCTNLTNTDGVSAEWFCDGDLGPGEGASFEISVTAGAAAGSITATGDADQHLQLPEFIETNNGPISVSTAIKP